MRARGESPLAVTLVSLLLTLAAFASPPVAAQPTARAAEEAAPRQHIVRPGETLEAISARFLGSPLRWLEIWRINQEIANPHRIYPGQRVRLPPAGKGPPAATMRRLSHQVTERPIPNPWSPAQLGDTLLQRDGVRTYPKSSAEMRFNDGTRLLVTEDSLVFLQGSARSTAAGEPKRVEIVEGQADYEATAAAGSAPAGRSASIEILLGPARLTSRPSPEGNAQARARRPSGGGSKVMVYGGAGEIEAGGATVALPEGSGTSVAPSGPPAPAERLLPAPRLTSPPAGAELGFANPAFLWEPVPEAASYVVELCRDEGCGALIDRSVIAAPVDDAAGAAASENAGAWQPPAPLPVGELYWRVTARSGSGLDGYPSPTARLAILSDRVDREPPTARLDLGGPHMQVGQTLFAGPAVRFTATAEDSACGVGRVTATIDGRPIPEGSTAPIAAGTHAAGGVAIDRCGNRADLAPIAFVVDAEPPAVRWEVGDRTLFATRGAPAAGVRPARRGRERDASAPAHLDWTADGRSWLRLYTRRAGAAGEAVYGADRIAADRPQIFLALAGVTLVADGRPLAVGPDQMVWITAEDAGCGVDRLSFRTRAADPSAGAGAAAVLEIDAVDLVGNARHLEWPILLR
jgi:hypothetical protein